MIDLTNGHEVDIKPTSYLVVGDFDSRKYGLWLESLSTPTAKQQGSALYVMGRNGSVNRPKEPNKRYFQNRILKYTFYLYNYIPGNEGDTEMLIRNDLMRNAEERIFDSFSGSAWYYTGIVSSVSTEDDYEYNRLIITIEFEADPMKRSVLLEGHDDWDNFYFDTDIVQTTSFYLPHIETQLYLNQFNYLEVGTMVTLGGWSQYRAVAGDGLINNYESERWYEIMERRFEGEIDFSKLIYSTIQYRLDDGSWVRAQDVVQARSYWVEATLHNTSSVDIIPEIYHRPSQSTIAGITVELDGNFYNFRYSSAVKDFNDKLALKPGENKIKIYGQAMNIDFNWRKEVF